MLEIQFFGLQLDRGNLSNALTDNLLGDLNMTSDDYNNVTRFSSATMSTDQSAGNYHPDFVFSGRRISSSITHQTFWLQADSSCNDDAVGNRLFVVIFLPFEFEIDLAIAWAQAWMTDRTSFYITRSLIGACEGGFIPGTILFTTYFYKSRELSVRLAAFWSTLNVCPLEPTMKIAPSH